jgi:long chain fatty acid CoA FadD26
MSSIQSSIPDLLASFAQRRPLGTAYTFVDYETDPTGAFTESLSWSEVHRRASAIAEELCSVGAVGDRAVILVPQGLDYILAFYGAMQAGFIAVPLSVPSAGAHDERVLGALSDCAPTAILTTSAVVDSVLPYATCIPGAPAARVIEVDAMDYRLSSWPATDFGRHHQTAYLQYTSGSTRRPAGVVISHRNIIANLDQIGADYFEDQPGSVPPDDISFVSWLPFYHDMGLIQGVLTPFLTRNATGDAAGRPSHFMTPMAFLQRPARWMQMLAAHSNPLSSAPNFAFELTARRTSDEDLAGQDLSGVLALISGSERIHVETIRRFTERFARFDLPATAVRPSYGLAEATLYVTSAPCGTLPKAVHFDVEKLSAGYAKRREAGDGCELISYGKPRISTMRIVDPENCSMNCEDKIGEIWLHGDNVASGYWLKSRQADGTFGAQIVNPGPDTPVGPWLRTGDLGVISQGELFIIGRIKDLLIVDGRNHYPDDIEATIHDIARGRVAAIAVPDDSGERLVTIVEIRYRGDSEDAVRERFRTTKLAINRAVSQTHGVRVNDLVLVEPGAIPITTSGKVRRAACVEQYRRGEFDRLDS